MQPGMVSHLFPDVLGSQLIACRYQVAPKVPHPESVSHVAQAVEQQQPRKSEVPTSPGPEIVIGRQGQPSRKGTCNDGVVFLACTEEPRRRGAQAPYAQRASKRVASVSAGDFEYSSVVVSPVLAQIQPRVSVEDLKPAREQERQRRNVDPVSQTHCHAMSLHKSLTCGGSYRHRGAIHGWLH